MKKEILEKHIAGLMSENESLESYFQASYHYSFWEYIKIGLGESAIFVYYVAVTNTGLHFIYIDEKDQIDKVDFYNYKDIKTFKPGGGFTQRALKLNLANGGEIKLKGQLKGLAAVPKYTDRIEAFLHEKIGR